MPLLRRVLQTVPPTGTEWLVIAACSLAPIPIVEAVKLLAARVGRGGPAPSRA